MGAWGVTTNVEGLCFVLWHPATLYSLDGYGVSNLATNLRLVEVVVDIVSNAFQGLSA